MYLDGESFESILETCSAALGVKSNTLRRFFKEYAKRGWLDPFIAKEMSLLDFILEEKDSQNSFEVVDGKKRYFLNFNQVAIFHITTRINKESCMNGIIPLCDVVLTKNEISDFLAEHGMNFIITDESVELHTRKERFDIFQMEILYSRLKCDTAVGGFLFNHEIRMNTHTKHIALAPELFENIEKLTGNTEIKSDWKEKSQSYIIKFIANIEDIAIFKDEDINSKKKHFIEEYLMYAAKVAINEVKDSDVLRVFLKEKIYISPEAIVKIID